MRKILLLFACLFSVLPMYNAYALTNDDTAEDNVIKGRKPMMRYQYEFIAVPIVGAQMEATEDAYTIVLNNSDFMNRIIEECFEMESPFADGEVKYQIVEKNGLKIIVLCLPDPKEVTNCLYIAWVPKNGHFVTYSLEKTYNFDTTDLSAEVWVIGKTGNDRNHSNFGNVKGEFTPEDFVNILAEKKLLK